MSNKVVVAKSGFNVLTETNPKNLKFSSDYGTLKYYDKQPLSILLPAGDLGASGTITHNLGYYPFVEAYVKNPVGDYEYCPSFNGGASVEYNTGFEITATQIKVYVGTTGFFSDITFNFLIFLFKNNLGFS